MKNRDALLLEEAYELVQLNEGIQEAILKPLFHKIALKLKEKAPEAFAKLRSAKTSEELIKMLNYYKKENTNQEDVSAHQQNESIMDAVGKVKKLASDLYKFLDHPARGSIAVGGVMNIVGFIVAAAVPCFPAGILAVAGLLLLAVGTVGMSEID